MFSATHPSVNSAVAAVIVGFDLHPFSCLVAVERYQDEAEAGGIGFVDEEIHLLPVRVGEELHPVAEIVGQEHERSQHQIHGIVVGS